VAEHVPRRVDAVWRIEAAKIIAGVARIVHDVGLAEDLAQEAWVSALEHWPRDGWPDNPGAWLMATAKNKALDHLRARALHARKQQELGADADARGDHVVPDFVDALDDNDRIGDDVLRLMFAACHPLLGKDAQTALTLKLLGGLSTEEIARAYLVPEPTIAQRIVRAKKTLSSAGVPFEVPRGEALQERLDAVLEVIYLIFNEGYSATAGCDWLRPALCEEAQRLARVLVSLAPRHREALGLLALLELQASRLPARTNAQGQPVLLMEQNRSRWDRLLIARGLAALGAASTLPGPLGLYELQADIAACHARALTPEATDWRAIVAAYDRLVQIRPSPVAALNRLVAVGMTDGAESALPGVDVLAREAALKDYPFLPAVRGDLLFKLGRMAEAREAFERAASLTRNARDRDLLLQRARNAELKRGDADN
jgi:RNA polymerase sigma factor (sigma-70 family)